MAPSFTVYRPKKVDHGKNYEHIGPIRIPSPKPNALGMYHPFNSPRLRYRAITATIRRERKPLSKFRHLVLLSTLTKRTIPKASKIYRANAAWVKKKFL